MGAQMERIRANPLYMAHARKDQVQLLKQFVAEMVKPLVEPLVEDIASNSTFGDDDEDEAAGMGGEHLGAGGLFAPYITDMWAKSLVDAGSFDGLIQSLYSNMTGGQALPPQQLRQSF